MSRRPHPVRRAPGAALGLLLIGYPVWWLLGITVVMTAVTVGLLVAEMSRMPRLRLPRFGTVWLLFIVWVLLGVLVVQVDAPLAIAGWSTNRYFTWAFRLFWYIAATVLLVYFTNLRDLATRQRVFSAFGWMFVWIVIGGYLGVVLPGTNLTSALELILPHTWGTNLFVQSLVHPAFAEHMQFAAVTRPSAPFAFANVWGLNFACFLPFFCLGWGRAEARWKRRAVPIVLVAAVVPVIFSLNRGLWLALAVTALVVTLRAAAAGDARVVRTVAGVAVLLVLVVTVSPLRGVIEQRFSEPNSDQGRTTLAVRGFQSTLASPLLGFGTTRQVQGNFTSISGGATPQCPRCGAPSYGTQGQLFLLTFAQGYGGLVLYLGFVLIVFVRAVRRRGAVVTMALGVVAAHGATLLAYSADNLALLPIFAALGLLAHARDGDAAPELVPLLTRVWRRGPRRIVATIACGGVLGLLVHVATPQQERVSTAVLIGGDVGSAGAATATPVSLDSVAQMIDDHSVVAHVAAAVHQPPATVRRSMSVVADPNTEVLVLTYAARDAHTARVGSRAYAHGLLDLRAAQLATTRAEARRASAERLAVARTALHLIASSHQTLAARDQGPAGRAALRQLVAARRQVVADWTSADAPARAIALSAPPRGRIVGPSAALTNRLPAAQPIAEGLALGVVAALALARTRRSRSPHPAADLPAHDLRSVTT